MYRQPVQKTFRIIIFKLIIFDWFGGLSWHESFNYQFSSRSCSQIIIIIKTLFQPILGLYKIYRLAFICLYIKIDRKQIISYDSFFQSEILFQKTKRITFKKRYDFESVDMHCNAKLLIMISKQAIESTYLQCKVQKKRLNVYDIALTYYIPFRKEQFDIFFYLFSLYLHLLNIQRDLMLS